MGAEVKLKLSAALLIASSIAIRTQPLLADNPIKEKVFEDCPAAIAEAGAMTPAEKDSLASYLIRVLKIRPAAVNEMLTNPVTTGATPIGPIPSTGARPGTSDDITSLHIWSTLKPKQLLEAKMCAVELLRRTAPSSFAKVPEMITLANEPALPTDIRDALTQAAWEITVTSSHDKNYVPAPDLLRRLLDSITGESAYLAENILVELRIATLPFLSEELAKSDPQRRQRILQVLLRFDDAEVEVLNALAPLLQSGDEAFKVTIIQTIEQLRSVPQLAIPLLVRALTDLSHTVATAAWLSLRTVLLHTPETTSIHLEPDEISTFVEKAVERSSPELNEIVRPLFSRLNAADRSSFITEVQNALVRSEEEGKRIQAVRMLGMAAPNDDAYTILLTTLYHVALPVRLASVEALVLFDEKFDQTIAAFGKALKSATAEKAPEVRRSLIAQIAYAISSMKLNRAQQKSIAFLVPYFVEALSFDIKKEHTSKPNAAPEPPADPSRAAKDTASADVAVQALVVIGTPALPATLKMLRNSDVRVRRRAVRILSAIDPSDARVLKELVSTLSDNEAITFEDIIPALLRVQALNTTELVRVISEPDHSGKVSAALILIGRGSTDAKAFAIVLTWLKKAPCATVVSYLKNTPRIAGRARTVLVESALNCVEAEKGEEAKRLRHALIELLPQYGTLSPTELERLLKLYRAGESAEEMPQLLDIAAKVENGEKAFVDLANGILKTGDERAKANLFTALEKNRQLPQALHSPLKQLAMNRNEVPLLRGRAYVLLARFHVEGVDYQQYFIEELGSERKHWAQNALRALPPEEALPLLVAALRKLSEEEKSAAAESLSAIELSSASSTALRSVIDEALQGLQSLAVSENEMARAQAIIALARFEKFRVVPPSDSAEQNAQNLGLLEPLRRELIGPYREALIAAGLYQDIPKVIDEIIANPRSFVELQAATRMKNS